MPHEAASAEAREIHSRFSAALLDPGIAAPPVVIAHDGKNTARRFDVYRNNVVVSLIGAVIAIYPAVQKLTGADFFRAIARAYIRETPPKSALLFEYGREFPAFIDRYPYALGLPWLSDVARVERAWLDSYHAQDAAPLNPNTLSPVPPERLGELRFIAHPAARIVRSQYAATSIFSANREEDPPDPAARIESSNPQDTLITRPGMQVEVRQLPPGGAAFLLGLLGGHTLSVAVEEATHASPAFDLPANLAGALEAGVFGSLQLGKYRE
jgi:Putative DNA-binding domain